MAGSVVLSSTSIGDNRASRSCSISSPDRFPRTLETDVGDRIGDEGDVTFPASVGSWGPICASTSVESVSALPVDVPFASC